MALVIVCCFELMTSCQKHTEEEITKRQYIAGTNILQRAPIPYLEGGF